MKLFNSILLPLTVALLLTGCNKSGSTTQTPKMANVATNGFGGYVKTLGQVEKSSAKTIDVSYLNQAVQLFNTQEGRYPKTLQELVPNYVGKIPDAPFGYKITYDPDKGEVKVVQQ